MSFKGEHLHVSNIPKDTGRGAFGLGSAEVVPPRVRKIVAPAAVHNEIPRATVRALPGTTEATSQRRTAPVAPETTIVANTTPNPPPEKPGDGDRNEFSPDPPSSAPGGPPDLPPPDNPGGKAGGADEPDDFNKILEGLKLDFGSEREDPKAFESPTQVVMAFITRVWEHPLIDDKTRAHRQEATVRLANLLTSIGLQHEDFATVPVGSTLWAADNDSDFDYMLVLKNRALRERAEGLLTEEFLNQHQIDIHEFRDVETIRRMPSAVDYSQLLLTPDDYISGNIALVSGLRLDGINHIAQPENAYQWDRVIRRTFDSGYKYWESNEPEHHAFVNKATKDDIRDRATRFNNRLERRASQTHAPERYKKAFLQARENLTLPDFNTFQRALNETQGRLAIHPPLVATGIE